MLPLELRPVEEILRNTASRRTGLNGSSMMPTQV
jgi:hypothetical protein